MAILMDAFFNCKVRILIVKLQIDYLINLYKNGTGIMSLSTMHLSFSLLFLLLLAFIIVEEDMKFVEIIGLTLLISNIDKVIFNWFNIICLYIIGFFFVIIDTFYEFNSILRYILLFFIKKTCMSQESNKCLQNIYTQFHIQLQLCQSLRSWNGWMQIPLLRSN